MVFGNGIKNIQAAAYNGARMVVVFLKKVWKLFKGGQYSRKYSNRQVVRRNYLCTYDEYLTLKFL